MSGSITTSFRSQALVNGAAKRNISHTTIPKVLNRKLYIKIQVKEKRINNALQETPGNYETRNPLLSDKRFAWQLQTAGVRHTFVRFQGIANAKTAASFYLRYD